MFLTSYMPLKELIDLLSSVATILAIWTNGPYNQQIYTRYR